MPKRLTNMQMNRVGEPMRAQTTTLDCKQGASSSVSKGNLCACSCIPTDSLCSQQLSTCHTPEMLSYECVHSFVANDVRNMVSMRITCSYYRYLMVPCCKLAFLFNSVVVLKALL